MAIVYDHETCIMYSHRKYVTCVHEPTAITCTQLFNQANMMQAQNNPVHELAELLPFWQAKTHKMGERRKVFNFRRCTTIPLWR